MENRKGRISQLTGVLKNNGIDLVTLSIADTKDFGILRCITRDNDRAEKLLRDARIYSIFEGTNQVQRQVIGKTLLG